MKPMRIEAHFSSLKEAKVHEQVVRFVLGGAVTVAVGLIAKRWGPVIGGLFLAFPSIFPSGATLIEEHEIRKKREIGRDGRSRGREAAGLDALGAALGSVGLAAFAVVLWRLLPAHTTWVSVGLAVFAWLLVSGGLWVLRRRS
jgi:hypothetical protein